MILLLISILLICYIFFKDKSIKENMDPILPTNKIEEPLPNKIEGSPPKSSYFDSFIKMVSFPFIPNTVKLDETKTSPKNNDNFVKEEQIDEDNTNLVTNTSPVIDTSLINNTILNTSETVLSYDDTFISHTPISSENKKIVKIDKLKCSKDCCKFNQWENLPYKKSTQDDYLSSNMFCNFGESSGCVCMTAKDLDSLSNRY